MHSKMKANSILKFMFILGAIVDGAITASWFLIASGWKIPNIVNDHRLKPVAFYYG